MENPALKPGPMRYSPEASCQDKVSLPLWLVAHGLSLYESTLYRLFLTITVRFSTTA